MNVPRIFILSIRTLCIAAGYFVLSIAITEPVNLAKLVLAVLI
ncbi:hypothetical protein FORC066_1921 [Yersinia enterocolitica]|nr:hypothetical protein FORC066_1921 [Yersinia enterocolitica]